MKCMQNRIRKVRVSLVRVRIACYPLSPCLWHSHDSEVNDDRGWVQMGMRPLVGGIARYAPGPQLPCK